MEFSIISKLKRIKLCKYVHSSGTRTAESQSQMRLIKKLNCAVLMSSLVMNFWISKENMMRRKGLPLNPLSIHTMYIFI